MFIKLPSIFTNPAERAKKARTEIQLQPFLDFEFDSVGWYSFGHHAPRDFLAAVEEHDPSSISLLEEIQLAWGKSDGRQVEISDSPIFGFRPITYIEHSH